MEKTKLIILLKTFTKREFTDFGMYIHSPLHNQITAVSKLYDAIAEAYPDFELSVLNKERMFRKIYGNKSYNDVVMRGLISDLLASAQDFLAYMNFRSAKSERNKYLLIELKKRGQVKLFEQNYNSARKLLDGPEKGNAEYFYNNFIIE